MVSEQLLSEINDGQGESLTRLAKRVPSRRAGRPTSLGCILRWVLDGSTGPDGQRIRLEAAKTPCGWVSSPAALSRFLVAITPTVNSEPVVTPTRSPTKRERASQKAAEELAKVGI